MSKDALLQAFHDLGAFKWNAQEGFRLASGKTSPYYVDCRIVLAHPYSRHLVAQLAFDLLKTQNFDLIGGLEIGAIPLATSISDFAFSANPQQEWRTFVVRKQPKDHGLGKLIEGTFDRGEKAVVVDDVLTTGGSLLKATDAARNQGLQVSNTFVIVDRSENDRHDHLTQQGLHLFSLLTLDDLKRTVPTSR
jgi:orotate phosphoribosyltransferase